jgi:hypothetical protein
MKLKEIQEKYKKLAILWNDIEKLKKFQNFCINYFCVVSNEKILFKNYNCNKYNLTSTYPLTTLVLLVYKNRPDWRINQFLNLSCDNPSQIIMNSPPIPHWRNKNKTLYVQNVAIDERYNEIYKNIKNYGKNNKNIKYI